MAKSNEAEKAADATTRIRDLLEDASPLQVWWWRTTAFLKRWGMPGDWLLLHASRGHASWCGRFVIIHAPRNVSLIAGNGTQGLELFRWLEHG